MEELTVWLECTRTSKNLETGTRNLASKGRPCPWPCSFGLSQLCFLVLVGFSLTADWIGAGDRPPADLALNFRRRVDSSTGESKRVRADRCGCWW